MRYADGPTTETEAVVAAPVDRIWPLVTDQEWLASVSSELQRVEWLDGATGAGPGVRFRGHNAHSAVGEWSTVSTVTTWEPGAPRPLDGRGGRSRRAGRPVGLRPRPGRGRDARAAVGAPGPRSVRADPGDRAVAGQGGADRRGPSRRVARRHGAQPRRRSGRRWRPADPACGSGSPIGAPRARRAGRRACVRIGTMLPGLDTLLDRTSPPATRGSATWPDAVPGPVTGPTLHPARSPAASRWSRAPAPGWARRSRSGWPGSVRACTCWCATRTRASSPAPGSPSAVPGADLTVEVCDVGELSDVRRFAAEFSARVPELDLLVHNAGLLPSERSETSDGNETDPRRPRARPAPADRAAGRLAEGRCAAVRDRLAGADHVVRRHVRAAAQGRRHAVPRRRLRRHGRVRADEADADRAHRALGPRARRHRRHRARACTPDGPPPPAWSTRSRRSTRSSARSCDSSTRARTRPYGWRPRRRAPWAPGGSGTTASPVRRTTSRGPGRPGADQEKFWENVNGLAPIQR